jgi:hypothetical protein
VCFLAVRALRKPLSLPAEAISGSSAKAGNLKYAAGGEPHPSESHYHCNPLTQVSFGGESLTTPQRCFPFRKGRGVGCSSLSLQ